MERNYLITGLVIVVLLIGGVLLFSGGDDEEEVADEPTSSQQEQTQDEAPAEPQSNIVELAQATPDLSTLVSAVVEADLVDTLSSPGPFTVFAPTNDAFGVLLNDLGITAEELLAREDLGAILTYHVVGAEVFAADLSDGQEVTTVQGGTLTVNIGDSGVTLTDANGNSVNVVATDVDASNGVVHLIDGVVLP